MDGNNKLSTSIEINVVTCLVAQKCSTLTKGSTCRKNKKIEIFVDLNRAGHDKSVEKKLAF